MLARRPSSLRAPYGLILLLFVVLIIYHFHFPAQLNLPAATSSRDLLDHIDNSTFGFENIFVVGLPARTDRRDGMVLQAALSDIKIEFVDGVRGDDVSDKALPNAGHHERLGGGAIGCWRAHMDAIQEIVRRNISSALILEDDADWDVRIRQQLRDFALSTRALTQPLADYNGAFADPTYRTRAAVNPSPYSDAEIPFDALPRTVTPHFSPYGDAWDFLWLGHCGMQFPSPGQDNIAQGRVIHKDDETVPERRYLYSFSNPFTLVDRYPEHTRAVHHVQEGVCSLGYAVTQQGARRLLQEVALMDVSEPFDILLRFYCEGTGGRTKHLCLAPQPALFNHHRPAGPDSAQSDIGNHGDGFRDHSQTDMIRWSTRLNANAIMDGETVFWDQYPNSDVVG